jgi:hypothetical protein
MGQDARLPAQEVELLEGDVADAEQAGAAAGVDRFDRPPGLPVIRPQAGSPARAVEQVGVDDLDPQVLERTGE